MIGCVFVTDLCLVVSYLSLKREASGERWEGGRTALTRPHLSLSLLETNKKRTIGDESVLITLYFARKTGGGMEAKVSIKICLRSRFHCQ